MKLARKETDAGLGRPIHGNPTFLAWIPDSNPPSKKLNYRNSESGLSYMEQNGSLHKRLKIAIC